MILSIPQFPQYKIHIHNFTNVLNASEIKENLLKGNKSFDFAFITSLNIISLEQLSSAIYRSLLDLTYDRLRTKSLHSEIIFSLSPTQNIMDALKKLGIQDDTKDLVVIKITQGDEEYDLSVVKGDEIDVDDENFIKTVDLKKIQKIYKIDTDNTDLITRQIVNSIQLRGH